MHRKQIIISVIGLGYIGLYVAVGFAKKYKVIGFDIDSARIKTLKTDIDSNHEIHEKALKSVHIHYTNQLEDLKEANFHIVAVPTPIDRFKNPNLSALQNASQILGKIIKKGDIIVYESTVYPGATEEVCIPLLEKTSQMKCSKDFFVGYSPERINPSDKHHTLTNTPKIVSAKDPKTLKTILKVYQSVIKAKLYPVSCIQVAESAKLVENTQRDINIALINEIALILNNININTTEVLSAAETKWNFIACRPGLVGGHCIGFNSHLLAYKSEEYGYHPNLIHAARDINILMPKYIARETIKRLIKLNAKIKNARIGVLGFTYKEDCPDYRDTKVNVLIDELKSYQTHILVHDPLANHKGVKKDYDVNLTPWNEITQMDALIIAVSHQFYHTHEKALIGKLKGPKLIVDIKSMLNPDFFKKKGIELWQI